MERRFLRFQLTLCKKDSSRRLESRWCFRCCFSVQNDISCCVKPDFDFSNILEFNVSNNNLSGPVPDVEGKFSSDSFAGNPGLCGKPLLNSCPPSPPPEKKLKKKSSDGQYLIYSGYGFLGLIVLLFIGFKLIRRNKKSKREANIGSVKKDEAADTSSSKSDSNSIKLGHKSEYSISAESRNTSSSLAVLTSPLVTGMKFEDLLQAPAELLGRGKHGSLYKVQLDNGVTLVVKRIKDWKISGTNFKRRMQRLDQVRHPNVLPAVAFYCSKQEKLLVYEFQPNNSLFNLLHGSQNGQQFDWGSRLNVAASVAEALTFMHHDLLEDGIAHGNLKSTNILFDKDMDPHVSEYGLMVIDNEEQSLIAQSENSNLDEKQSHRGFKMDVYGFGVILLELLTGRLVQNNGFDLARWVHSVVREEWTGEVFDKSLMGEGASEERMVNLLQVALKCITTDSSERPSIDIVALMINSIKEEEERSISSDL